MVESVLGGAGYLYPNDVSSHGCHHPIITWSLLGERRKMETLTLYCWGLHRD